MIRHRFVVVGAFQILNAVEARYHFGLKPTECELVLLLPPQRRAATEARALIQATGWDHVREIGPPSDSVLNWFRKVRNARNLISESHSLDRIYIGDYQTQLARHAAHGVEAKGDPADQVVVLDDGMGTRRVNDYRVATAKGAPAPRLHPQVPRTKAVLQHHVARGLGLRVDDLRSVNFFSIYDLTTARHDAVTRNTFEWTRTHFGQPDVVDGTLFLGSPFVESGIVERSTYHRMLTRLREEVEGPLWYRPHPRETTSNIESLGRTVSMQILELDTVVEFAVPRSGWVPRNIVTNHSTTVDTLRVLFDDQVRMRAVPIPLHLVPDRWKEWISRSYRELDDRMGEPVERLVLL